MELTGNALSAGAALQGAAPASLDMATVVTRVPTVDAARALPKGTLIGDTHGGLTFSDAVAYALEKRSDRGWFEMMAPDGNRWTVIRLSR
jgi:hypothetical protein